MGKNDSDQEPDANTINLSANTVNVVNDDPSISQKPSQTTKTKTVIIKTSTGDIQDEPWFTSRWRPAAAWVYLFICIFDFVLAPVGTSALNAYQHIPNTHENSWQTLTTQGGSIFHLSFGAIIGISAYGRTREKIAYDGEGDNSTPVNSPRNG